MGEDSDQVGLGRDLEGAELALDRQDRIDRHAAIEPGDMSRGEDRPMRHSVDQQPGDLARSGRQIHGGGKLGSERRQILAPRQRMSRKQLARRLVEPAIVALPSGCTQ